MSTVPADSSQYTLIVSGQRFQILSVSIQEEISHLSSFTATVHSTNPALPLTPFLRQPAEVRVVWGSRQRSFFGIVSRAVQTKGGRPPQVEREYGEYLFDIVPKLWETTRRTSCRIFQDLRTDDILRRVLDADGLGGKYRMALTRSYPVREYCTQYRESDYAFLSRLMEEEGIFFFFTHDGREELVIADSASAYATAAPDSRVSYRPPMGLVTEEEVLLHLEYQEEIHTGKVKFEEYDYRQPRSPLRVDSQAPEFTDLEEYDYHPELYRDDGRGRTLARNRWEGHAAHRKVLSANGPWRSGSAGHKLTLQHAFRDDLNAEWVVYRLRHHASQYADSGVSYDTSIDCLPSSVAARPERLVPRPHMGPQTAEVVGPSGQDIYMDDQGRAKVQFHWDLDGRHDENSSCWIRVASGYAGFDERSSKKHGIQFHPLIGDEVVVDFLEGDPDKPLVTGAVWNADHQPIVQPSQLVRNRILTPYQHELDLDDRNAQTKFRTGGDEQLWMADGTRTFGNTIQLSTADDHVIVMAEKEENRGIRAETVRHNKAVLDDAHDEVTLETKEHHQVKLSDERKKISVRTTGGHRFELSDANGEVEIFALTTAGHQVLLSDTGRQISLETADGHAMVIDDARRGISIRDSNREFRILMDFASRRISIESAGDISITAGGTLSISAASISMTASGSMEMRGNTVELTSESSYSVSAGSSVSVTAGSSATYEAATSVEVSAMQTTIAGQVSTTVRGATVDVQGTATASVSAALVRIN
jgi:type VI secretion system VgrG family protein